jgi:hypothetical protein
MPGTDAAVAHQRHESSRGDRLHETVHVQHAIEGARVLVKPSSLHAGSSSSSSYYINNRQPNGSASNEVQVQREKLGLNFESRTGKFEQCSDDF